MYGTIADRSYRVRGLAKNLSYEVLKVNILASKEETFFVDTFDLYAARARSQYLLHAAKEIAVRDEIVKVDVGRVLGGDHHRVEAHRADGHLVWPGAFDQ